MSDERRTRLVLVRHGESEATVRQVVGGHEGCTGLSPWGRRQAEALRDRLTATGELRADAVYASVLPRAIETAEIMAAALGGVEVRQECGLCELHAGEGDGLSWEEYEARYRREGDPWPFGEFAPGGESWAEFVVRAGRALRQVVDDHEGETVVVVCHGGVIEASFFAFGNLPMRRDFDLAIENTGITEWERVGHRWRLVRFNDDAHLRALQRPARH